MATGLFLIALFTLIAGKGFPHFRGRGKARLFVLLSGFFVMSGAIVFDQEREAHLAELYETNPVSYLTELREFDEEHWLVALQEIDPDAHAQEVEHRTAEGSIPASPNRSVYLIDRYWLPRIE